jgi:hypothetical protein
MTIATNEEYERKRIDFDTRKQILDRALENIWTVPCSIQLNTECFDDVWKRVGCDQNQPYTEKNTRGWSYYDLIDDAYKWSTFSDDKHPKIGCYKNPNADPNPNPKDYAKSVLDKMKTEKGMTFEKNGQGVDAKSEYDCGQICLRQKDCTTATFNSTQGKCWTNDNMGMWTDYVDYKPSNDAGDVAIYNKLIRETKQLYDLNEELAEYDMRVNNIQFGPIFAPGSGTGYNFQDGNGLDYGDGRDSGSRVGRGGNDRGSDDRGSDDRGSDDRGSRYNIGGGNGRYSGSRVGAGDDETSIVAPSAPVLQNVLDKISAISQTIASLAGDFTDTKKNISSITNDYKDIKQNIYSLSTDVTDTKQKVTTIDTDRAAIAKTLEEYNKKLTELSNKQEATNATFATFKKQEASNTAALLEYKNELTDMSQKQDESNAELKKQVITIVIIAVVGIVLIFLMAAAVQSMGSSNQNDFSGGGAKKICSGVPLKVFPFNSISLKHMFKNLFNK